jgi:hypothetical protein
MAGIVGGLMPFDNFASTSLTGIQLSRQLDPAEKIKQ